MALKALKCPNCEANIQVDDGRDLGFCSYCGAQIQIKEVIEIHYGKEADAAQFEKLMEDAQAYLLMGDYFRAEEGFMEIIRKYPGKAVGYERLICAITHEYMLFPLENAERLQKLTGKMMAVATEGEKVQYEEVCQKVKRGFSMQSVDRLPSERIVEIAKLKDLLRNSIILTVVMIGIGILIQDAAETSLMFSLLGVVICLIAAFAGYQAIVSKIKLDKLLEEDEAE